MLKTVGENRHKLRKSTFDFPEWFRHKILHLLVSFHHESQRGELTASITDQLFA